MYTIKYLTEDKIEGDVERIKTVLTPNPRVVDNGIGRYAYGSIKGIDSNLDVEIDECVKVHVITEDPPLDQCIRDLPINLYYEEGYSYTIPNNRYNDKTFKFKLKTSCIFKLNNKEATVILSWE